MSTQSNHVLSAIEGYLASKADGGDELATGLHTMLKQLLDETASDVPVLVIDVEGGLIQNMTATRPVRVIVLDADVEGAFEDDLKEINGDEYIVSDYDTVSVDVECVNDILAEIASNNEFSRSL